MLMGKLNLKSILNGEPFQGPICASKWHCSFKGSTAVGPEVPAPSREMFFQHRTTEERSLVSSCILTAAPLKGNLCFAVEVHDDCKQAHSGLKPQEFSFIQLIPQILSKMWLKMWSLNIFFDFFISTLIEKQEREASLHLGPTHSFVCRCVVLTELRMLHLEVICTSGHYSYQLSALFPTPSLTIMPANPSKANQLSPHIGLSQHAGS